MRSAGVPVLVLIAVASMSAGCNFGRPPSEAPDAAGPLDGRDGGFLPTPGDLDEGGEVRVEHVRFADGNAAARVTAFIYEDSGSIKFFPYPDLTGCSDAAGKTHWPTATNPVAERVYLDPGKVIVAGGPEALGVSRRNDEAKDVMGRTHAAGHWFSHFLGETGTDGPTYLAAETRIDVVFTGSDAMPGQVFNAVVYMPPDFELVEPGTAPVALEAGTPLTVTWTTPSAPPPSDVDVFSQVAFVDDATQELIVLCFAIDDGSVTVPAAMIDLVRAKAPQGGTLRRQTLTMNVRELVGRGGPTGRRLDFIATWGYETRFTVQP